MSDETVRSGDSLKPHGDKLQAATGAPNRPVEVIDVTPHGAPLKDHGDKLQSALDRATGA